MLCCPLAELTKAQNVKWSNNTGSHSPDKMAMLNTTAISSNKERHRFRQRRSDAVRRYITQGGEGFGPRIGIEDVAS